MLHYFGIEIEDYLVFECQNFKVTNGLDLWEEVLTYARSFWRGPKHAIWYYHGK